MRGHLGLSRWSSLVIGRQLGPLIRNRNRNCLLYVFVRQSFTHQFPQSLPEESTVFADASEQVAVRVDPITVIAGVIIELAMVLAIGLNDVGHVCES